MYAACERFLVSDTPTSHVVHLVHDGVDLTRWPENALENGEFASWAGQPMANPGCPARTMSEWQQSRPGVPLDAVGGAVTNGKTEKELR